MLELATAVPRPAYLDLIDEHNAIGTIHHRRAAAVLILPAVVGFVVGVAGTVAYLPIYFSVVVGLVVGGLLAAFLRAAAPGKVLKRLGARSVAPGELDHIDNMLESLSFSVGVAKPDLYVVGYPAVEVMAVGLDDRRASLVVTSEVETRCTTMELEALLAHGLVRIKDSSMAAGTVAVTTLVPFGGLGRWVWSRVHPEPLEATDYRTVRVTHYPPALATALASIEDSAGTRSGGTDRPGGPSVGHLWTAPGLGICTLHADGVDLAARRQILDEI